jgi:hypothetical protein
MSIDGTSKSPPKKARMNLGLKFEPPSIRHIPVNLSKEKWEIHQGLSGTPRIPRWYPSAPRAGVLTISTGSPKETQKAKTTTLRLVQLTGGKKNWQIRSLLAKLSLPRW